MKISEVEYPLRLCIELINFTIFSCKKTENMTYSEIKTLLLNFFSEDDLINAQNILQGKSEQTGAIICDGMNWPNKNVFVGGDIKV
jgi:hypothetical protein